MLVDLEMPDTTINDQPAKRIMLASTIRFIDLDFSRSRFVMLVPVLHYVPETIIEQTGTVDNEGNETLTSEEQTINRPINAGLLAGRDGLLYYRMAVDNSRNVDRRTGEAEPETEENSPYMMPEFNYLRAALNSGDTTLEALIMVYLSRIVLRGTINTYDVIQ